MRTCIVRLIPKPIAIQPVHDLASRAVIHWCADAIKHAAVGIGIKPHMNLFPIVNGGDESSVFGNPKSEVLLGGLLTELRNADVA